MNEQDFYSLLKNSTVEAKEKLNLFFKELIPVNSQHKQSTSYDAAIIDLFQRVTKHVTLENARELSKQQRDQKQLRNSQFNYGEITVSSIFQIVALIQKHKHLGNSETFYDLGSGSGKVVLAAALCFPFKRCTGIEFLECLHLKAQALFEKAKSYMQEIEELNHSLTGDYHFPQIKSVNQDFKKYNWSDGTIIFVSSTCYNRQMMEEITQLTENMPRGTIMVTLTRKLESLLENWKILEEVKGQTSWGTCTIYIQRKEF